MKVTMSVIAMGSILLGTLGSGTTLPSEPSESKDDTLIINWNTINMWNEMLDLPQQGGKLDVPEVKTTLEQRVDEHAKTKVDMIVQCVFVLPWGTVHRNFQSFYRVKVPGYSTLFHPGRKTGLRELEKANTM